MLSAIAYCSLTEIEFSDEDLLALAEQAANRNQEIGVTGYLYYRDYVFMQYLEGDQTTVEMLMAKITHDARHRVITEIFLGDISQRRFPHWYMRFLGNDFPRHSNSPIEEEFAGILESAAQHNYRAEDVADAVLHVTERIKQLDW
jgi:hypothetical protein